MSAPGDRRALLLGEAQVVDPSDFAALGAALGEDRHLAVILADGVGNIRIWNRGAEALFGHSAADVAGRRVDLIVPPAYREMHWAGFNRTMGTPWLDQAGWGEIDGLHRTGELVMLEVLLTPMRDAAGLTEGVFAMFRRRSST